MFQTATFPNDRAASVARPVPGWGDRFRTWRPGLRPRAPAASAGTPSVDGHAPSSAPTASHPSLATCDFWPLIEGASQSTGGVPLHCAAQQQALCELRGTPPGQPLVVRATESDLQALLAHLSAITRHVMGPKALPRATARIEAGHAVLHWGESGQAEHGLQLARLFSRLSSLPAAPTPADAALHHSVQWALRIVQACGGRLYPSASPLALMRLTARLPLVLQPDMPMTGVHA